MLVLRTFTRCNPEQVETLASMMEGMGLQPQGYAHDDGVISLTADDEGVYSMATVGVLVCLRHFGSPQSYLEFKAKAEVDYTMTVARVDKVPTPEGNIDLYAFAEINTNNLILRRGEGG